jgi:hypothetical protein
MRSVPSPCGYGYGFAVFDILGIDGRPAVNLIASVLEHLSHLKFHLFKITAKFCSRFAFELLSLRNDRGINGKLYF